VAIQHACTYILYLIMVFILITVAIATVAVATKYISGVLSATAGMWSITTGEVGCSE